MSVPVIVMAGGECGEDLLQVTHEREKAFVPVGGKPLVEHLVAALKKVEGVGPLTFVGNVERLQMQFGGLSNSRYIRGEPKLFDNVMNALKSVADADRALVCACDTPLVTPEMITWFLSQCTDPGVDFCYPISEKRLVEKRFPDMRRTYVGLSDGTYTGGNMMVMRPARMMACEPAIREAIALRKKPLRLAGKIGFGFLVRLLTRRLSVAQAEETASQLLGIRLKAVVSPFPEMGCDLDKAGDYRIFEGLAARR